MKYKESTGTFGWAGKRGALLDVVFGDPKQAAEDLVELSGYYKPRAIGRTLPIV